MHAFNNPPPSTRPKKKHFWKRGSATLPQVALNVAQHTFSDLALNADSIKSPCIDFILPFRINEYQLLADCAVARRKSVFPDAALAKKIEDKLEFSKLLLALGFSDCVPKIGRPSNMRLPIICKKRIGENGANMRVLCSEVELSQAETAEYFFQEYVPGPE